MVLLYSCVVKNTMIVLYSSHSKILLRSMILLYSCEVKNTMIVLYTNHAIILRLYCTVNIQKYYDWIVQCTGVSVWRYLVHDCKDSKKRRNYNFDTSIVFMLLSCSKNEFDYYYWIRLLLLNSIIIISKVRLIGSKISGHFL